MPSTPHPTPASLHSSTFIPATEGLNQPPLRGRPTLASMADPIACLGGFRQPTPAAPSTSKSPRAMLPSPSAQPLPRPSFSHSDKDAGATPGDAGGGGEEISASALEGQRHLQILGTSGYTQGVPCLDGYQHPPAALPSGVSGPMSLWPVRRSESVLAGKSSSYIQIVLMLEWKQANLLR